MYKSHNAYRDTFPERITRGSYLCLSDIPVSRRSCVPEKLRDALNAARRFENRFEGVKVRELHPLLLRSVRKGN